MNKIQQYKEILEHAPEGATHYDNLATWKYKNLDRGTFLMPDGTGYKIDEFYPNETICRLSDLQTIVEQAETIERLKITTDNSKVNAELIKENERLKACVAELGRYLDIAERHLHDEHFTYYAEDCEQLTPPECK